MNVQNVLDQFLLKLIQIRKLGFEVSACGGRWKQKIGYVILSIRSIINDNIIVFNNVLSSVAKHVCWLMFLPTGPAGFMS